MHGGGVRGIVSNVDEVLANLALEAMGAPKGGIPPGSAIVANGVWN